MKKRVISAVLALALCLGLVPAAFAAEGLQPVSTDNGWAQDYDAYGKTVKSYLYQNPSGGLTRVEYVAGKSYYANGKLSQLPQSIVIEDYSSSFQLLSSAKIPMELDLWGGFYAGKDYNFFIQGQRNPGKDDSVEVIRVIKYDKNWNRLGQASLNGANTTTPFAAGSVRCDEYNGYLFIHTCHDMYDGHQANLTFSVRESDMSIADSYYDESNGSFGYVSHSFNQFILVDSEGKVVAVNHGDTFPRGIAFTKYNSDAGSGRFTGGADGKGAWCSISGCLTLFAGGLGNNSTGASVGGLEETSSGYVAAYNYDGGHSSNFDPRHVYLSYVGKDGKVSDPKQLTNAAGNTTPMLFSNGLGGGYVVWNGKSGSRPNDTLYYAAYDAGGNVGEVKTGKAMLSDCRPILYQGSFVWYTCHDTILTFYALDGSGVRTAASMDAPFVPPAKDPESTPSPEPTQTPEPSPEPTQTPEPSPEPTDSPEPPPAPAQAVEKPDKPIAGTPTKPVSAALLNDSNSTFSDGKNVLNLGGNLTYLSPDGTLNINGVKVPGGSYKAVVSTSGGITLLKEDGTLWSVKAATDEEYKKAEHVKLLDGVVQIQPGLALTKDGTVWSSCPLLVDNPEFAVGEENTMYKLMDGVKQIYSQDNCWNGMAVKKDGSLWIWGFDVGGLGAYNEPWLGQSVPSSELWYKPRKVMDNVAYATGTMAIKTDGTLWSWGSNSYGAVGNGGTKDQATPVKILDDVIGAWTIHNGYDGAQKYALTKDGTLYSWGENSNGWLGYQEGDHSYTLRSDSTKRFFQSEPRATGITDAARVIDSGILQKTDGSVWTITEKGLGKQLASSVMLTQTPAITAADAYTVTTSAGTGGTVNASDQKARKGDTVTVTVTPNKGYVLDGIPTAKDAKGNTVSLTSLGGGRYTFVMGESNVTVSAKFKTASANPFTDVREGEYYYEPVLWAVEKGVTTGTSATTFSPSGTCTRAQTVTFLWRAAGSPTPSGTRNPFTDVKPGDYFYDAVLWAVEKGITNGTSATKFSPNATVTRGQTVTFMYREAGEPGVAGSSPFRDVPGSAYYADAVRWAVAQDITNGTGPTTFGPDERCTRGQIVTFLHRANT